MSNQQKIENGGILFPNQSDNPKAPIKKGKFTASREVIEALKNGEAVEIAVWNKTLKSGQNAESFKISPPYKKREDVDEAF